MASKTSRKPKLQRLYDSVRMADMRLKLARVAFLEAAGWHQLPNGTWLHADDYKLVHRAEAAALAGQADGSTPNLEHLFLSAEQACAIAAHRMLTWIVTERIERAAEKGKHRWQAVGSAGDAADMTVYKCARCDKHRTTNGEPATEGCAGKP